MARLTVCFGVKPSIVTDPICMPYDAKDVSSSLYSPPNVVTWASGSTSMDVACFIVVCFLVLLAVCYVLRYPDSVSVMCCGCDIRYVCDVIGELGWCVCVPRLRLETEDIHLCIFV